MSSSSNNASNIQDKITDKANQTANEAKDPACALKNDASSMEEKACAAGKNVSEIAGTISSRVGQASSTVTGEIRNKPVQSALIALALGIAGTLFYKRSA